MVCMALLSRIQHEGFRELVNRVMPPVEIPTVCILFDFVLENDELSSS